MQVTQAESSKCKGAGVKDFTFYSTFNYNNMKKFIKSKINHNDTANRASPYVVPIPHPSPNVSKPEKVKPEMQPPLPLDPPLPPDKPPNLNITLKKEIEDMEYQSSGEESSKILNQEELSDQLMPSKPMCRDFIRGKCTRHGTCKFSHKRDTSQLVGVYTFCRNFQNSICTLPNCKYVHATVFEEQHFYRTAELPPHALAHHKKMNVLPPPPPPPKEPQPDVPTIFSYPPPPLPISAEIPTPVIGCIPASNIESGTFPEDFGVSLSSVDCASTFTHELANLNFFGCSPSNYEVVEEGPRECTNCDFKEFRLQYNQEKVEEMKLDLRDLAKKSNLLDQKSEKLYSILLTLFKQTFPGMFPTAGTSLATASNIAGDAFIMEHLRNLLQLRKLPGFEEDTN